MATRADILYLSATDQDQAWGTDVRKLAETAQALNSTTICTHPNAASTTQITLDPLTNSSTQSDIRDVLGWAVNEAGTDGMESTSTYKRRIRAGDWVFTMRLGLPTPGTVTGTLTGGFIARVYRVGPSPTFTRTTLFTTALSTTVQSTGLGGATGTCSVTQAGVAEIVLQAGETIHVGYLSNVVQVAGLLGATVSGVATWHVGTQGGVDPSVNPPAIDTITEITGTATAAATASGSLAKVLPVTGTATAAATASGSLAKVLPVTGAATAAATVSGVIGSTAGVTGAAAGAATVSGTVAAVKGLVGSSAGVATVNGRLASVKGLTGAANVSSGGGTTIVRRRKIVIYDKA